MLSIFELFKIGIGPSSSHTVGPMIAARRFAESLTADGGLETIDRIEVKLHGSLAFTGKGHGSDRAIMMGLMGEKPDAVDPREIAPLLDRIGEDRRLALLGRHEIAFAPDKDILFDRKETLPAHSNGMRFRAYCGGELRHDAVYYSVGGGFVLSEAEAEQQTEAAAPDVPYPFTSAEELLARAAEAQLSIAKLAWRNELARHGADEVRSYMDRIRSVMNECIDNGCKAGGELPGGLQVKRRARDLEAELTKAEKGLSNAPPPESMDWINLWALAVNEENAAGGRVVTAPTNGAAGIIPAVLRFYERLRDGGQEGVYDFLLTATAIGSLYKMNASISGAEVGCQGEVGVACSMAAAGLTAALGGSNAQIENAAEIGMEHNLGLTCDPVGGLVQIPCIERNAIGANKAVIAAQLALRGTGAHHISLDQVIETMFRTGRDMREIYKETSQGGLAVHFPEC